MKHIIHVGVCSIILMFFCISQSWAADDWTGNVNVTGGTKWLETEDWGHVKNHLEYGIHADFRKKEWPINIEIALTNSYEKYDNSYSDYHKKGTTHELRLGVKKIWEPNQIIRPFIGGGLAYISGEKEYDGGIRYNNSDRDTGLGIWINSGLYWTLGTNFNLGFEIGYSKAQITLFDHDIDAGGGHAGLLLGYHW